MAIKTPGSLGALQYVAESTYGTTPSTALSYFGFMNTMQESGDSDEEEQLQDGSRIFQTVIHRVKSAGFTANLTMFRDENSVTFLKNLVTKAYGPTADLGSFSALMKIGQGEYAALQGCKIDTLEVGADRVGDKVTASVTVKALRALDHSASKPSGWGSENAGPTNKIPIIYDAYATATINGNSKTINAKSFKFSINNSLEEQEGIVNGVAYTAGNGLVPGVTSVELEYSLVSADSYWDNLKLNHADGITIVQVIGAHTYTFANCYIVTEDHPSRAQSSYDETVRFKAGSLTVS